MFQRDSAQQSFWRLFILILLLVIGIGLTVPVSADSGPLFTDGIVTGRIVDADGNGVPNLEIVLQSAIGIDNRGVNYDFTDADGYYTITPVSRGSYYVRISDFYERYAFRFVGGGLQQSTATRFEVWNATPVEVNEMVEPGGFIEGVISTAVMEKNFSPSIRITFLNEATGVWVTSDFKYLDSKDNGYYRIGGLAAGTYHVSASDYIDDQYYQAYYANGISHDEATGVPVAIGQTTRNIDITLGNDLESKTSIGGRVVSAETGQPLEGIDVQLYTLNVEAGDWLYPQDYASTNSNGEYQFKGVRPNNYKVEFDDYDDLYATVYNGNKPTLGGAPEITVVPGDQVSVDVEMVIGGVVTLDLQMTGMNNTAGSYSIHALRWNEHDAWLEAGYDYYHDDEKFEMTGLIPGTYVFRLNGSDRRGNYIELFYGDGTGGIEEAKQVGIGVGSVIDLGVFEISREVETSGIIGYVFDANGNPVANARVDVFSAEKNVRYARARTNADGSYNIQNIETGVYKIRIRNGGPNLLDTWYGNVLDKETATILTLTAGRSASADVHLISAGSIQGVVTVASNFKYDYSSAQAWRRLDDKSWFWEDSISIAADGSYLFDKLRPGHYRIYLSATKSRPFPNPGFSFGEWIDDVASQNEATIYEVKSAFVTTLPPQHLGNIIASSSRTDGAISGQILSAAWKSGEAFEAHAYRMTFPPRGPAYWVLANVASVDEEGNYLFDDLLHGRYVIGFYDTANEHKPEYYNNVADIDSATIFTINAETTTYSGVDAILQLDQSHVK